MKRMMVDIEVYALRPEAVVLQIGFCVYDFDKREYVNIRQAIGQLPELPEAYFINLDVGTQLRTGRAVDQDTLLWWMDQKKEVRDSVMRTGQLYPVDQAFFILESACNGVDEVWAKPAMFDIPILWSLWNGRKPWGSFRKERDMSTFAKLIDPNCMLEPPDNTMEHNGAADAKWQMDYLINLFNHFDKVYLAPGTPGLETIIL